jgi:prephenate dehydratase
MASIRKVGYYSTMVPNRPGAGAKLLDALRAARVSLLAFTGFPERGGAQVDFVAQNEAAFRRAAKKAGVRLSARKRAFLMQGADRPGALTGALGRLARAGINLVAIDAVTAGKGRFGAIFWVKPPDYGRAARLLRAR